MAVSLDFETTAGDPVMGIDEAGRGPLAGGVYAAAVSVPLARARVLLSGAWAAVTDSKKLTARRRDALAAAIRETPDCAWAVASASAAEQVAARLGAGDLDAAAVSILVDGLPVASLPRSTNVVKGDAKSLLIAAASILAKTARDADCLRLDRLYPGYGFAQHKGYPTPAHMAALNRLGPCPEHRRSFGPVAQMELGLR